MLSGGRPFGVPQGVPPSHPAPRERLFYKAGAEALSLLVPRKGPHFGRPVVPQTGHGCESAQRSSATGSRPSVRASAESGNSRECTGLPVLASGLPSHGRRPVREIETAGPSAAAHAPWRPERIPMKTLASTCPRSRPVLDVDTARELMTPSPVSIRAEATVAEAVKLLTDRGFSAAPVIDRAGRPVGVVSRSDILVYDREKVEYIPSVPDYYGRAEVETAAGESAPEEAGRDAVRVCDIMTPIVFGHPGGVGREGGRVPAGLEGPPRLRH